MRKTKAISATLLALLLAAAATAGLAACGLDADMTNDDAEALSAAMANTLQYEGSYTVSADIREVSITETGEQAEDWTGKADCSYDAEYGREYLSEEAAYLRSDELFLERYETYVVSDPNDDAQKIRYYIDADGSKTVSVGNYSFDLLYRTLDECSLFDLEDLENIYNTDKLESVVLGYASNMGYRTSYNNANVKMKVSGSAYTLSASFEAGKISIAITVKDGFVTKISMSEGDAYYTVTSDIEISYDYKSSLASNFSDLESFETVLSGSNETTQSGNDNVFETEDSTEYEG